MTASSSVVSRQKQKPLAGSSSLTGTEVKIDGEDLLIMKESDILGIVG
jgi:hypothetical protein